MAPNFLEDANNDLKKLKNVNPLSSTIASDHTSKIHKVKHYFPPSIVSWIEENPDVDKDSYGATAESRNELLDPSCREASTSARDLHLASNLMNEFMALAKDNTDNDLETCGILGAYPENNAFYVTTLIIPKQEATSSSCQALNEEEIHAILHEQSLFPAGWIHTHPSQTCFLSSVDLHTQYSYQAMLPEAVAIVMAPTDPTRNCGIFRLTEPGGISVLKECKETGFHPHPDPPDGRPVYEDCSNIYFSSNLRFEIIDLRSTCS